MMPVRRALLGLLGVLAVMNIYFALPTHNSTPHSQSQTPAHLLPVAGASSGGTPAGGIRQESSPFKVHTGDGVDVALDMYRRHGLVLFTVINDAYLPFALSWLCNTEPLHLHNQTVFLATDNSTAVTLARRWPAVTVVSANLPQLNGDQQYSQVGYLRLMEARTNFILHLLEAGVRLLLFEVDATWLANPLVPILQAKDSADILATKVSGKQVTAGGFLLLNPTPATLSLWSHLAFMMKQLMGKFKSSARSQMVSEALNDQEFLTNLLQEKYAKIHVAYLPEQTFPDGKWYSQPAQQRATSPRPIVINNNWIAGNANKVKRAKQFGHWFLRGEPANGTCNTTAVRAAFLGGQ